MRFIYLILRTGVMIFQRVSYFLTRGLFPPPFISVNVILQEGNKVLLIDRVDGKGLSPPGGFVGLRETVEDAAVRETREETGLDIELGELMAVLSGNRRGTKIFTVNLVYNATIIGDKTMRDSVEGVCKWIDLNNLEEHHIAFDHYETLQSLRDQ